MKFRKYDDPYHWGLFIPIGRRRFGLVYRPDSDMIVAGLHRRHLIITVKWGSFSGLGMRELRIRVGVQYL
jgi:hypothetical protein